MIHSRMWKYCNELYIFFFLLSNIADSQVNIPAVANPINGDTVNLTCIISAFKLPALWKNNDNGAPITTCLNSGTCSPPSDGVRYNFSATASSIIVTISRFNSTIDTFTWKCEHNGTFETYSITVATTGQSTQPAETGTKTNTAKQQRPGHILLLLVSAMVVLCSLLQPCSAQM